MPKLFHFELDSDEIYEVGATRRSECSDETGEVWFIVKWSNSIYYDFALL